MSADQQRASKAPQSADSPTKGAADDEKSLGAGSEAAQGVHGAQSGSDPGARPETGRGDDAAGTDRAGSEPLGREREHLSGYGGHGGAPKTSSDAREPKEPEGR